MSESLRFDIAQILRNGIVEDQTAHCGVDDPGYLLAADLLGDTHLDGSMQAHHLGIVSHQGFSSITEYLAGAGLVLTATMVR